MRYAGLIRSVMIGREGLHRDVLLRLLADAGAANGSNHLTTGNVLFDAPPAQLTDVVQRLEAGIAQVVGRPVPVIVRECAQLAALVAADPFHAFPADDWERVVLFLPGDAAPFDAAGLAHVEGLEVVHVRPYELLTAGHRGEPGPFRLLPPSRGKQVTSRTWGTVERLARLG